MNVFIIYYLALALIVFTSLCSSENIFFLDTFFIEWRFQNYSFHTQNNILTPHGCAELRKQNINIGLKFKLALSPKTASTLQVYF